MKIRSVVVELFYTERRTDRHDDVDMRSLQRFTAGVSKSG